LLEGKEIKNGVVIRSRLSEEIDAMLIQCQMSKPKVQIKLKIQMFKKESFDIKPFDIHLAFEL
jgi:hypothetical protein